MICYLVHGFNVKDGGKKTVDKLIPHLAERGFECIELDYGFFGLARVRLCNRAVARTVAATVAPDSIAIGHSNGCAIIYRAAMAGARFRHVTLINPALDAGKAIEGADSVNVWYSPSDEAVMASRLLWRHTWGNQGRVGHTNADARYRQFNADLEFGDKVGHSGIFERDNRLATVVDRIAARV